jgi:osmotically-inducible protein OsmY
MTRNEDSCELTRDRTIEVARKESERGPTMHKPDALVEIDVRGEFGYDPLLDASQIVVNANEGKVTLTGVVPTYYESVLAQEDAWRVGGVSAVDNQLLLGSFGEAILDDEILAHCVTALDSDRLVPPGSVSVAVSAGWVILSGEVRHHLQRKAAEHAVRHVDGLVRLTDRIKLTSDPIPSDVVHRIERAFRRNGIIEDAPIEVTSAGHIVYLDGTVPDRFAMDEAVGTAYLAPGVRDVVSRLVIVP